MCRERPFQQHRAQNEQFVCESQKALELYLHFFAMKAMSEVSSFNTLEKQSCFVNPSRNIKKRGLKVPNYYHTVIQTKCLKNQQLYTTKLLRFEVEIIASKMSRKFPKKGDSYEFTSVLLIWLTNFSLPRNLPKVQNTA